MAEHPILRVGVRILVPCILLFALYVQFHGDFGPGGGFQAGALFGAGCILYGLVFGAEALTRVAPPRVVAGAAAAGVLLYLLVGVASLLRGGAYLDYAVLLADPVAGQHLGIALIELGVGVTVGAVVIGLFFALTRGPDAP